jgi:hypothetical protein
VRDSIIASQGFADFFDSIGQKRSSRSRSAASLELDRSVRGGCRRRREAAVTLRERGVARGCAHDGAPDGPGSRRIPCG